MTNRKAPTAATVEALPSAKQIQEETAPQDAKEQARTRPGLWDWELEQAGVRHVEAGEAEKLCGLQAAGLWIPYPDANGYGRLRLDEPIGNRKYHQRSGSSVHAYLSPGAQRPAPGDDIVLVEGEFKSLSLTNAGIPTIGQSGFYGYGRDGRLVPELRAYIDHVRPKRILFAGDSDTALNGQFSHAAVKLADLVDVPVLLPRLPVDGCKAWDDLREELDLDDEKLRERWQEAVDEAEPVKPGTHPGKLAFRLLRRERERLKAGHFAGLSEEDALDRIVAVAAMAEKASPVLLGKVADLVVEAGLAGRREFRGAVKQHREKQREEAATRETKTLTAEQEDAIVSSFAYDGSVYFERDGDRYRSIRLRLDAFMRLHELGVPPTKPEGEEISTDKRVLSRIQRERRVAYAGPFCGRPAGIYKEGSELVLATTTPTIIEASAKGQGGDLNEALKNPGPVLTFVAELLGTDETQILLLLGWLQRARTALRHPDQHLPGQALVLIGAPDCGKTLFQSILTDCLGGREVDASSVLDGRNPRFNSHLFQSEHLVASDAGMSHSAGAQQTFREQLKQLVANERIACERKFADPLTVRPVWRITVSCNDDADSVGILPSPFEDPSFADKAIFFHCQRPSSLPSSDASEQARQKLRQSLKDDLPNFLSIVEAFDVPEELRKARFGVREYVNETVAGLLRTSDKDAEVVEIVSGYLAEERRYKGTAGDLYRALQRHDPAQFPHACKSVRHLSYVLQRMAGKPRWSGCVRWDNGFSRYGNAAKVFEIIYETKDPEQQRPSFHRSKSSQL